MKKPALVLLLLMIVFLFWTLFGSNLGDAVHVTINGQEVSSPIVSLIGGAAGLAVALVVLICTAILLLFVFAGVGLLIVGVFTVVGTAVLVAVFPFLFPLALPRVAIFIFLVILKALF
jgi:hypothetical protein